VAWKKSLRENLYWITGIFLTVIGFIFFEGWLIFASKKFGALKATAIISAITIPVSWVVIYLAVISKAGSPFGRWLAKKEEHLSRRAKAAVESGKFIVILNTSVIFGPILASILMLMLGLDHRKVYVYSAFSAILCAGIWCSFYAGVFWGIGKIF